MVEQLQVYNEIRQENVMSLIQMRNLCEEFIDLNHHRCISNTDKRFQRIGRTAACLTIYGRNLWYFSGVSLREEMFAINYLSGFPALIISWHWQKLMEREVLKANSSKLTMLSIRKFFLRTGTASLLMVYPDRGQRGNFNYMWMNG